MFKVAFSPPLGENRIKLLGKKFNWGRMKGKREEGKGEERREENGREWKEKG